MGKALLAAAVALGLLVVFVAGMVFYLSWSACLGGEGDALTGFPHYAEPESGPSPLMGACEVRYTTEASRKEVLGYYDEHLREDGWNVVAYMTVYRPPKGTEWPVKKLSTLSKTPESAGILPPVEATTTTPLATSRRARKTPTSQMTKPSLWPPSSRREEYRELFVINRETGSVHVGRQEAMRTPSIMRFILYGAVGFGIAWAIAGFLTSGFLALTLPSFQPPSPPPPPEWVEYPSQLAYFLGGACGGAALGLALRSWKRVVTFAVAGAMGFGVGSIISRSSLVL
jgi:hypothetical protein